MLPLPLRPEGQLQQIRSSPRCYDTSKRHGQHVMLMNLGEEITLYSSRASFHESTKAESSQISLCESCFAGIVVKISTCSSISCRVRGSQLSTYNGGTPLAVLRAVRSQKRRPGLRKKVESSHSRSCSDSILKFGFYSTTTEFCTMSKIAEEKGKKRKGMHKLLKSSSRTNTNSTIKARPSLS